MSERDDPSAPRTVELPRAAGGPLPVPPPGPFDGHTGGGVPEADHLPAPATDPLAGRPQRRRGGALVAASAGSALLLGLGGGVAGAAIWDRLGGVDPAPVSSPVGAGPVTARDDAPAPVREPGTIAGVAAQVLPSVVSVEVETGQGAGSGSGFVIDEDGLVLTNNHVIAAAAEGGEVSVVFLDGTRAQAELVGRTGRYDLAVLRVDRTGLEPLQFADGDPAVGDPVVAVGAPLGLQSTVTSGIVSALDRPVSAGEGTPDDPPSYMNAVQTDAAINPGNSGGPLVDLAGRVVGINSAIAQIPGGLGGSGGSIGLGFAIPAEQAVRTSQEIIETGVATYPSIGVSLDGAYSGEGVQVARAPDPEGRPPVAPGGPAERAGMQPGDVVLAFEGRPVTEDVELIVAIVSQRPGDSVTLTVERDGERRDLELVLDSTEED